MISFIVPIFNTQDYLVECLESILQQEIEKEIILIDDGSKDNSLGISLEYAHKYDFITLIHSAKNSGQSIARNKGIHLAKGKYIYFVDSDDLLLPIDLNEICGLAEQNKVDLIKFQAEYQIDLLENERKFIPILCNPYNVQEKQGLLLNGLDFFRQIIKCWIPGICWTIISREFLLENKILFEENVKAEDQLFYVQLLTCKPDVRLLDIGNKIYRYRIRKNSTITSYNTQYFVDHFKICHLLENWKIKNNFNPEVSENISIVMARIYQTAFGIYQQFSEEDKQKYANYFPAELYHFIDYYLKRSETL